MQETFNQHYPSLGIKILAVNEDGQSSGNNLVTQNLPMLQDVDANGDLKSDVWTSWDITWRDVCVVDRANELRQVYNLTQNNLANPSNYRTMKNMFIDVAKRPQLSPYQSPVEPLNVNHGTDDCITPLDALLVINNLGRYENGVLPPLAPGQPPAAYIDVTGDGRVAPLDALLVINQLNNITTCDPGPTSASSLGTVETGAAENEAPPVAPALTPVSPTGLVVDSADRTAHEIVFAELGMSVLPSLSLVGAPQTRPMDPEPNQRLTVSGSETERLRSAPSSGWATDAQGFGTRRDTGGDLERDRDEPSGLSVEPLHGLVHALV